MVLNLRGRLRAALLVALALMCLQACLPFLVLRLVCLVLGGLALGFVWKSAKPCSEQSADGAAVKMAESANVVIAASHDIRQPVQAIALFAASLQAYPLSESSRKLVSGIETGVQSLSEMLEAVFGLAKLNAGKHLCQMQALSLEDFFIHAVDDKLDVAHERQLHLRHASTQARVQADLSLLPQILAALLRHVLAQTEDGGALLGCRRRGNQVWVELRYSGTKTAATVIANDFKPGEGYCDTLSDKGYGLAYAQGLAELMGGALELFSWSGRGGLLRLRLQAAA